MNVDDGTLSFGTAIDMGGFDEGMNHIEGKVSEIGEKAEAESSRISELLTNIPDVNIDIITNASESLAVIQQGFDEIDRVVDINKAAIRDLERNMLPYPIRLRLHPERVIQERSSVSKRKRELFRRISQSERKSMMKLQRLLMLSLQQRGS